MEEKAKKNAFILHKYPIIKFNKIKSYIQKLLYKKYFVSPISYQKNIIKNIIYDDRTRIVALFKEQLIINDTSEYMKRFYRKKESFIRLKKYYKFYEEFSKLFPNYTSLTEAKYIYKNIHKKQKILDLQKDNSYNLKLMKKYKNKNNKIFISEVYESIEKNSADLNSAIFGIHCNEKNNNSILEIKDLISKIENSEISFENKDYKVNSVNKKNEKKNIDKGNNIKNNKNNIIINNYYYNNNSILTKNIPLESLLIYPQNNFKNNKNFTFIKNNILMNLKKNKKQKFKINSYTIKNIISSKLNNKEQKDLTEINKYNALVDNFNMTTSSRYNNCNNKDSSSKNQISLNINKSSAFSKASNNKINKDIIKSKILKNNTQQFQDKNMPNTARVYNYQNLKLISILKKLNNIDYNNGSKLKNNKKIKLDSSLIYKMINNNTTTCLSDRTEKKFDILNKKEKIQINNKINQTSREKKSNNLKKYLRIIKNVKLDEKYKKNKIKFKENIFKESLINNNKTNENKKKNNLKALIKKERLKDRSNTIILNLNKNTKNQNNLELKTDRVNYPRHKIELFSKNGKKLLIKDKLKKIIINEPKEFSHKNIINKNIYASNSFLTNENSTNKDKINDILIVKKLKSYETQNPRPLNSNTIIKKHKKLICEKGSKNCIKQTSLNMNNITQNTNYNVAQTSLNNQKMKIKGFKIKNLSKILNINNEINNLNSERGKNKPNALNMPKNKNKENLVQKGIIIKKNQIKSYTEREKAKRLLFSNII